MATDPKAFLSEIFAMPFDNFISSVGEGVTEAQAALDEGSLQATMDLYENTDSEGDMLELMQSIAYQPNFYGVRNVKGNVKIALSFVGEEKSSQNNRQLATTRRGPRLYATPVNPTIQNKYNYTGSAAAEMSFEIVPLSPAEQIRRMPDTIGSDAIIAQNQLTRTGLTVQFLNLDGQIVDDINSMVVFSQDPPPLTIMRLDNPVVLTLEPKN
ncbi:MAG: hypothetical protein ABJO36_11770 [Litorimonas sp.]